MSRNHSVGIWHPIVTAVDHNFYLAEAWRYTTNIEGEVLHTVQGVVALSGFTCIVPLMSLKGCRGFIQQRDSPSSILLVLGMISSEATPSRV